jgi:hypothetical protein
MVQERGLVDRLLFHDIFCILDRFHRDMDHFFQLSRILLLKTALYRIMGYIRGSFKCRITEQAENLKKTVFFRSSISRFLNKDGKFKTVIIDKLVLLSILTPVLLLL